MAIRLRQKLGTNKIEWEALCAAKTNAEIGDVYLNDAQHDALTEFYLEGLFPDLDEEDGDEDSSGNATD